MADFLFELGVEEVPVSEVLNIADQLKNKFQSMLKEQRVGFRSIDVSATNRRFMVYISGLNERAEDNAERCLGPSQKIAFDEKGNPTLALNKFLESHGVPLGDIKEVETKKGIYIAIDKLTRGKETIKILQEIIPAILGGLLFSRAMVWNDSRVPFVRPITSLLAILNKQLVPAQFAGIASSNTIKGHGLLSAEPIQVNSFRDYIEKLNKNFVIVKEEERKEKITSEIREIEEELNASIRLDDHMLRYYLYNNEYPVVFVGEFDKKYLQLPREIISTFMIKEKKLYPVFDHNNNLMNVFIGVSNVPDEGKFVTHGNQRVIQATFEDARFFWDSDRQEDFISLRENLKNVMFQKDLGTYFDKTERLPVLVDLLCRETDNLQLAEKIKEASLHCKNDLVTRMVREFPSLQGVMGGLYLREKKADPAVWQAVYGHYEPRGFSLERLESLAAGILSIADKIDNIAAFLSKGIKTSGSSDPYGIRRDSNGIIKIIVDFRLDFDFRGVIAAAAGQVAENEAKSQELTQKIEELFYSRMENVFKDILDFRHDIINSTLYTGRLSIYKILVRTENVSKMVGTDSIRHLVALHKRLKNIIKEYPVFELSEELLKETQEKILAEILEESREKIEGFIQADNHIQACQEILEMKPVIDDFFEHVLVMAEEKELRENRIALLQRFDKLLSGIANFSVITE